MSIYETNRFTLRSRDGAIDKLGIFPKAARVNHSCVPNVFHRFNPNIRRITMHAIRDIEPGDEIVTSYIDICRTTAERQIDLRHWGFECGCEACSTDDDEHEERRQKLAELLKSIEEEEGQASQGCKGGLLSIVEETITLMEQEGLFESDTLGQVYKKAAQHASVVGRYKDAHDWARKAAEVEEKCCGTDSVEYGAAIELLSQLRSTYSNNMT